MARGGPIFFIVACCKVGETSAEGNIGFMLVIASSTGKIFPQRKSVKVPAKRHEFASMVA